MQAHAYTTSDLANRRREVLDAARTAGHRVVIRDADGTLLTLGSTADLAVSDELVEHLAAFAALVSTLDADTVDPPHTLGALAFAAEWSKPRRSALASDLAEVLAEAARTRDPSAVRMLIDASKPRVSRPAFDGAAVLATLSEETRDRLARNRRLHRPAS